MLERLDLTNEAKTILEGVQIGFYYKTIEDGGLKGDTDCVQIVPKSFPDRLASDDLTSFFSLNLDDTNERNICIYLGATYDDNTPAVIEGSTVNPTLQFSNLAAKWYHTGVWSSSDNSWVDNNFEQYWLGESKSMRDVVERINIHLAHEVAHAIQFHFIYIEPDSDEVARIQTLVNELPANPPENFEQFPEHRTAEWRWTDYEKRLNEWLGLSYDGESQGYERELYAVVGTAIRNLPQELEDHYERFFKNRTKVIRLFEWPHNGHWGMCEAEFTLEECRTFYGKHFQEWDAWWGSDLL